MELEKDNDYYIVPHTVNSGEESAFTLEVSSCVQPYLTLCTKRVSSAQQSCTAKNDGTPVNLSNPCLPVSELFVPTPKRALSEGVAIQSSQAHIAGTLEKLRLFSNRYHQFLILVGVFIRSQWKVERNDRWRLRQLCHMEGQPTIHLECF